MEREKNLIRYNEKEYNIVTCVYNDDHEERMKQEEQDEVEKTMKKYWKTHDYDPVFVKYFDKEKEKEFQQLQKV